MKRFTKTHTCWSLVTVIGLAMTSMASALCGGADDDQFADDEPVVLPAVIPHPLPGPGPRLPGAPGSGVLAATSPSPGQPAGPQPVPMTNAQFEAIFFTLLAGSKPDAALLGPVPQPPVLRGITSDPLGFMGDTMDHDDLLPLKPAH